jgi:DNA/RNA non-specific endonuclease
MPQPLTTLHVSQPDPDRRVDRRRRTLRLSLVAATLALLQAFSPATVFADDASERAESEAAFERFGGAVAYGVVQPDGQRTASQAIITATIINEASARNIGSSADPDIIPPGFYDLGSNRSRGHVIGRQLGGSGDVEANLVALFQNRANSPVMSACEGSIADYLRDGLAVGDDLYYYVEPVYGSTSQDHPTAIYLYAEDDGAVLVDITIANTPDAAVSYGPGNQLC